MSCSQERPEDRAEQTQMKSDQKKSERQKRFDRMNRMNRDGKTVRTSLFILFDPVHPVKNVFCLLPLIGFDLRLLCAICGPFGRGRLQKGVPTFRASAYYGHNGGRRAGDGMNFPPDPVRGMIAKICSAAPSCLEALVPVAGGCRCGPKAVAHPPCFRSPSERSDRTHGPAPRSDHRSRHFRAATTGHLVDASVRGRP